MQSCRTCNHCSLSGFDDPGPRTGSCKNLTLWMQLQDCWNFFSVAYRKNVFGKKHWDFFFKLAKGFFQILWSFCFGWSAAQGGLNWLEMLVSFFFSQATVVPNLITYSTTLMSFEKANHWQEGLGTSVTDGFAGSCLMKPPKHQPIGKQSWIYVFIFVLRGGGS